MSRSSITYSRLNIYLDDPQIRTTIKIEAARRGVSTSAYCMEAIREKLARDRLSTDDERTRKRRDAARRLDALRATLEPVGVPVSELVREGRRFSE